MDWFSNQLHKDWQYLKKDGQYFILFTYPINLYESNLLFLIKPAYPWSSTILSKLSKLRSDEQYYLMTIEAQKNEIKKLKEIINKQGKN
jgi:hypothetical protein